MKELEIVIYGRIREGKTTLAVTIMDLLKQAGIGQEVTLVDEDRASALARKRERASLILKDTKISIQSQSYQREPMLGPKPKEWHEGYLAFERGFGLNINPYGFMFGRADWNAGWMEARRINGEEFERRNNLCGENQNGTRP